MAPLCIQNWHLDDYFTTTIKLKLRSVTTVSGQIHQAYFDALNSLYTIAIMWYYQGKKG